MLLRRWWTVTFVQSGIWSSICTAHQQTLQLTMSLLHFLPIYANPICPSYLPLLKCLAKCLSKVVIASDSTTAPESEFQISTTLHVKQSQSLIHLKTSFSHLTPMPSCFWCPCLETLWYEHIQQYILPIITWTRNSLQQTINCWRNCAVFLFKCICHANGWMEWNSDLSTIHELLLIFCIIS